MRTVCARLVRVLAIGCGAALIGTALTAMPPAAAVGPTGFINFTDTGATTMTYGGNQEVTIALGQIQYVTSDCGVTAVPDFIYPSADIWAIPNHELPGLMVDKTLRLHNTTGYPNAIVKGSSDGSFWDALIGYTAPNGSYKNGSYSIVIDECQDGYLHDIDQVYSTVPGYPQTVTDVAGFTVSMPTNVPIPPNVAILKAKKAAEEEAQRWLVGYGLLRIAWIMNGFMEAGGVATSKSDLGLWYFSLHAGNAAGVFGPDPVDAANNAMFNQVRRYLAISKDPADPNYEQLTTLGARLPVDAARHDDLMRTLAALESNASTEQAISQAVLESLERYQGAQADGNGEWALVQARQIRDFATLLAEQAARTGAAASAHATALENSGLPFDSIATSLEATRAAIAAAGLTIEQQRPLRNVGLDDADIAALVSDLTATSFAFTKQGAADAAHAIAAGAPTSAAAWTELADAFDGIATTLAADVDDVVDHRPVADAGGPYTGTSGTPIDFTAAGTTGGHLPLSYEWDLDGDGSFDDSTALEPSSSYDLPHNGVVGVRVTNLLGRSAVDYAPVTVAAGNGPPVLWPDSPSGYQTVDVGSTRQFVVSATDSEGDPTTISWKVDGVAAGTGETFDYTPGSGAVGVHLVTATAIDTGHPARGSDGRTWLVTVPGVDGDSDGWAAAAECNDGDDAVHPGISEVALNGIDDDCDAGTPDQVAGTLTVTPETAAQTVDTTVELSGLLTTSAGAPLGGAEVTVTATGANPQTFTVTTDATGTAAIGYIGTSAGTDTVTVTVAGMTDSASVTWTTTPAPPTAPLGLSAASGPESADLTWEPPASDGGSPVMSYEIVVTPASTTGAIADVTAGDPLSAHIDGLADLTTHTVQVRAVNAGGAGPWAQTSVMPAPLTPASITVAPDSLAAMDGTNAVVSAQVLNTAGRPVPLVPVTFGVTGRNDAGADVLTDANGLATMAYNDQHPGSATKVDTVTATVDALTDSGIVEWGVGAQPFADLTHGPIGVVATQDRLLVTLYDYPSTIMSVDQSGAATVVNQLPFEAGGGEHYLALSPGLGGFTAGEVYAIGSTEVWRIAGDGSSVEHFAHVPAPDALEGITFDRVGSFGHDLIVTDEEGGAWRVNPAGDVTFIGSVHALVEGPSVAPMSFAPYGGQLILAAEYAHSVFAMDQAGVVTKIATVESAEAVHVVPESPCEFGTSGGAFFTAEFSLNRLVKFPASEFAGKAGSLLVPGEYGGNITELYSSGGELRSRLFATGLQQQEGSSFVDCFAPGLQLPGAPVGLAAAPSDSAASTTWAAPTSDGGTPIDRYDATVTVDGLEWSTHSVSSLAALPLELAGLVNGVTYTLSVRAHNAVGHGPAAMVEVTPAGATRVKVNDGAAPEPVLTPTTPTSLPLRVDFAPTVVDTDSAVATWQLFFGDGTSSTGSGVPPATVGHTYPGTGPYNAYLRVVDTTGLTGDSSPVAVTPTSTVVTADNAPPTVTAPSNVSVDFSDAVNASVTATDPDAGDTVTLGATGLPGGVGLTDHGNRTGTISGLVTDAPATYAVTVSADDGHHSAVTDNFSVTVTKEDCAVTMAPAALSQAGGTTRLSATFADPDATPGPATGRALSFSVSDSGGQPVAGSPFTATTGTGGVGFVDVALTEGVYAVSAAFAGDATYEPCGTSAESLVTVSPALPKATGGGWISAGTGRTSFGFNVVIDVTGVHGQLQLRTANKHRVHGNTVVLQAASGAGAMRWTGTGRWDGAPGYSYEVAVVDGAAGGTKKKASPDTFSIVVKNAARATVFSTGGPQALKGGNITVK